MPVPAQPRADLLPVQREATLAYRAIRLWAVPLLHALFRINVDGRGRIPTTGPYGAAEGEILSFKKGFAHFAVDNQVPVLPVALSGTKDLWLRKPIRMIIGRPIESTSQTVDSMVALAEARLRELLPPYQDPGG